MKTVISAIQWMAFMIAGAIAAPVAVADLFHLSPAETTAFVQRTIFVLGAAGLLQALTGHRLPINEGPAGLWWGVFAIYAGFTGSLYVSGIDTLRALSGGMIVSGVIFFVLSLFGLIGKLARLFTPTVTFIYLMLLILQLSGSFMKGMLGLSSEHVHIRPVIGILSFLIIVLTFYLGRVKLEWVRQYSIMIALASGWLLFAAAGAAPAIHFSADWFALPAVLDFGAPSLDSGIIVTSFFISLLLITNMIASVRVMEETLGREPSGARFKRAGFVSGVNQVLGGVFSAIGSVPISGAAGFVKQTGLRSLRPFAGGAVLVILVSLLPPVMDIMASLPAPVGYAVTFVIFTKMVGMAFSELDKVTDLQTAYTVAGLSFLIGIGVMFLPPEATVLLPAAAASLVNNGLVLGTIVAIIVEQSMKFSQKRDRSVKH